MANKVKEITFPDGQTRRVRELKFDIIREEWNEYSLPNGMKMRLKSVVQKVFLVVGDDDQPVYTSEGEPLLLVRSNNQVSASE